MKFEQHIAHIQKTHAVLNSGTKSQTTFRNNTMTFEQLTLQTYMLLLTYLASKNEKGSPYSERCLELIDKIADYIHTEL